MLFRSSTRLSPKQDVNISLAVLPRDLDAPTGGPYPSGRGSGGHDMGCRPSPREYPNLPVSLHPSHSCRNIYPAKGTHALKSRPIIPFVTVGPNGNPERVVGTTNTPYTTYTTDTTSTVCRSAKRQDRQYFHKCRKFDESILVHHSSSSPRGMKKYYRYWSLR